MRKTVHILKYVFLSLFALSFLTPLCINWLTSIITPVVLAQWVYARLVWLQALYAEHNLRFQVLVVGSLIVPMAFTCLVLGAITAFLDWFLGKRKNVDQELNNLIEELSPLLLVYDPDYDLVNRLRKLLVRFDERKFVDLRTTIYEALYENCGPDTDGKQTFFVIETPNGEGTALLSVVNDEVKEELYQHLVRIRVCEQAKAGRRSQAIQDIKRDRDAIKDGQWSLPDCKSIMASPVFINGDACGVLGVYHDQPNAFSTDVDLKFLELLAAILGLAYTIKARA